MYIKPDKSKEEVKEFQRLGKQKMDFLNDYPTVDEGVTLQKGSLKVDGDEVDKYTWYRRFITGGCHSVIYSS